MPGHTQRTYAPYNTCHYANAHPSINVCSVTSCPTPPICLCSCQHRHSQLCEFGWHTLQWGSWCATSLAPLNQCQRMQLRPTWAWKPNTRLKRGVEKWGCLIDQTQGRTRLKDLTQGWLNHNPSTYIFCGYPLFLLLSMFLILFVEPKCLKKGELRPEGWPFHREACLQPLHCIQTSAMLILVMYPWARCRFSTTPRIQASGWPHLPLGRQPNLQHLY